METKNVLITGGSGFIGTHLARKFISEKFNVRVLDLRDPENSVDGVEYIKGDIRIKADMGKSMKDIHCVYHLAAIVSIPQCQENPDESYGTNLMGTWNVLEAIKNERENSGFPIRLIFASSAAVYGYLGDTGEKLKEDKTADPPISFYGAQKLGSEHMIRNAFDSLKVPALNYRFFNIYGPGQDPKSPYSGVITIFSEKLKNKENLSIFGDGNQTRDFLSVYDLAKALFNGAFIDNAHCNGQPINLGTSEKLTVQSLAENMIEIKNSTAKVNHLPVRQGDIIHSCSDNSKAKEILKWEPEIKLKEGLKELI